MHPEIENLINMALADGEVTEKERAVILRKAESLGIDKDEVEMILDAKLHQLKTKANESKKENVNKCPSCGDIIQGLTQVCSSCGYILNKSTIGNLGGDSIHEAIQILEQKLLQIKTVPLPSVRDRINKLWIAYITLGLSTFFTKKNNQLTEYIGEFTKQMRHIESYYGSDSKVKSLLNEIENEISTVKSSIQQNNKKANIYLALFSTLLIALTLVVFMYQFGFNISDKQDIVLAQSLVESKNFVDANKTILSIKDKETRSQFLDKLQKELLVEIESLINQKNYSKAQELANLLIDSKIKKSVLDDIDKKLVFSLLENIGVRAKVQNVNLISNAGLKLEMLTASNEADLECQKELRARKELTYGFSVKEFNDTLVVVCILPEAPCSLNGLHVGSQIISINGNSVASPHLSYEEKISVYLTNKKLGEEVKFEYIPINDNTIKTINIVAFKPN